MHRVIAGRIKGMAIRMDSSSQYRPITNRVKEALFDMLQLYIEPEHSFLDLFGGSGQVGIEAWSRGVEHVTVNERAPERISLIRSNLEHMKIFEKVEVAHSDYHTLLKNYIRQNRSFDYIFSAPPYARIDYYKRILFLVNENPGLLTEKGLLILEFFKKKRPQTDGYKVIKEKYYGSTGLLFLAREQKDA